MAPPSGQKVTLMTGVSPSVPEDLKHSGRLTRLNSQTPEHALGVRAKHLKGLDLPQLSLTGQTSTTTPLPTERVPSLHP